ncbi:CHRD domain-containing protein [Haloarcula nitratireducens]|uniref:CHRD domain-containing protein n=1 Tax=Haloarcula nitratireducens TaxID=2487749 RepID=A0AAW4P7P5_9EURY|nr:CHRD domain-containing protein [Halomicroarcula nitratireducens]MBX0293909.1 CHRD domain-containing protein [Halomicroarcula nitratireducens]
MDDKSSIGGDLDSSRRTFLRLVAATGALAGTSATALAQTQPISLDGSRDGWVGRSPASISGTQNPTLQLRAGETYTLTWTNIDGRPHNFVITDGSGSEIFRTDILMTEGETQTVEIEATEAMQTYYCEVHPNSMRGTISTGNSGGNSALQVSEAFSAGRLSGTQERPDPVETAAAGATLLGLDQDGTELHYSLLVADIDAATQAHIHLGAADENGPPVAFLFGAQDEQGAFTGPLDSGISGTGVFGRGSITDENLVGPLAGESLDALLSRLRDGTAYVNVHTEQNPAGEIRGQIQSADSVRVALREQVDASLSTGQGLTTTTQATLDVSAGGQQAAPNAGQSGSRSGAIDISYEGTVGPGNRITITATIDGDPVTNADVYVKDGNGDRRLVGQTDQDGQFVVVVPATGDKAGELNVQVRKGELEGELEVENGR